MGRVGGKEIAVPPSTLRRTRKAWGGGARPAQSRGAFGTQGARCRRKMPGPGNKGSVGPGLTGSWGPGPDQGKLYVRRWTWCSPNFGPAQSYPCLRGPSVGTGGPAPPEVLWAGKISGGTGIPGGGGGGGGKPPAPIERFPACDGVSPGPGGKGTNWGQHAGFGARHTPVGRKFGATKNCGGPASPWGALGGAFVGQRLSDPGPSRPSIIRLMCL